MDTAIENKTLLFSCGYMTSVFSFRFVRVNTGRAPGQGVSISDKTPSHKISQSLNAARFVVRLL